VEIKMKKNMLLFFIIAAIILTGCSGKDESEKDKIPPIPPDLIHHLGDTGDPPVDYEGQSVVLNEDNNGIDAVPDGDWIRVLWAPFKDIDLSHIKVFRFSSFNPDPVFMDSISASAHYYLDTDNNLIERVWYSYFIDLIDLAGNVSRSDTTSYALLPKSMLISPADNSLVSPYDMSFQWQRIGSVGKFRIVFFDEYYNYVWHEDITTNLENEYFEVLDFPVNIAQQYAGQSLRWRVDSFEYDADKEEYMGSESNERIIHIRQP
jgi:hypothetical protein